MITGIKKSLLASAWFMFLTFPIMVIRVNPIDKVIHWRFQNMLYVGVGIFFAAFAWRWLLALKERGEKSRIEGASRKTLTERLVEQKRFTYPAYASVAVFAIAYPLIFPMYPVNIMGTALIFVILGLGLNIVVGLAGLLDLGYVAFYAVGAYSYALLNQVFPWYNFWVALPVGALLGAAFGVLLGFPVLRLRGDYLAIVTLGFGEIIRLILENWNAFSHGPSGIANIPKPGFFGMKMSLDAASDYIYYILLALTFLTIFSVNRLRDSRIGRAWIALREDEVACQAMGIDKTKTKLTAFALGATWAGMAGVVFAAKTSFINPASFTFMESAIILSMVVLGGKGSIVGVVIGALVLYLLPEYLREVAKYRMLVFGASMVLMMVFRPQGLVSAYRRKYVYKETGQDQVKAAPIEAGEPAETGGGSA